MIHAMRRLAVICAILSTSVGVVFAQAPDDFYQGRTVSFYVGSSAGGGYDAYARLLARHIGGYIPGQPTVIVQNMPGAGSLTMSNFVVASAPKDGTAIAAPQSSAAVETLLHLLSKDGKAAKFDAAKLNWLGSATQDIFVMLGSPSAKARSVSDMKATQFVIGASGPNTDGSIIVATLNELLGTKIKLVTGYSGTGAQLLAVERGEIDGAIMAYSSASTLRPDLATSGKFAVLLQVGDRPSPKLKDVPFLANLLANPADKTLTSLMFDKYQMGRPYFVAQEVPKGRVVTLRKAFEAALRDPKLLAEADKQHLDINPVSGDDVQSLVERLHGAAPELATRARNLVSVNR